VKSIKIVLLCVVAAVVYGELQDQVTARVCVEYFTIGHPRVIASDDPTDLALVWGVLATWWVGLILGVPLALAARAGSRPKLAARHLLKPIAALMACVGLVALVAGIGGWFAADAGWFRLFGPLASRVPPEKHVPFLADGSAHTAAYAAGFLGGLVVCGWAWHRRKRLP
jgi:hypothetical protein